ncbi:hypothetical protein ACFYXL_22470 [Streptomyces tsukubensis]|uniref:hypothetical protein n=1 Tax=Streptomyces tsukubensis TaxID=83656 RepID=UPI0036B3DE34
MGLLAVSPFQSGHRDGERLRYGGSDELLEFVDEAVKAVAGLDGGLPVGLVARAVLTVDHVALDAVFVEPCLAAAVHFPELADQGADLFGQRVVRRGHRAIRARGRAPVVRASGCW